MFIYTAKFRGDFGEQKTKKKPLDGIVFKLEIGKLSVYQSEKENIVDVNKFQLVGTGVTKNESIGNDASYSSYNIDNKYFSNVSQVHVSGRMESVGKRFTFITTLRCCHHTEPIPTYMEYNVYFAEMS